MKKRPRILVVGSQCVDITSVTENFPQSGQTVLGTTFSTAPGGKGANQAMEAALLGAEVIMVGKAGQDVYGDESLRSLSQAGVNISHINRTNDGTPNAIGNIIITTHNGEVENNRIIVIPGANMKVQKGDISFLKDSISNFDIVLLQFEIPMEINQLVASLAFNAGVPVIVNPAPYEPIPDDLIEHTTYITPNETEAERILGCYIQKKDDGVTGDSCIRIKQTIKQKRIGKMIITLGSTGAMMVDHDTVMFSASVPGIQVVDPTAAGDSFVGAFAVGKCVGLSDIEAMKFANMIAARTVSIMGAQPSLSTLEQAIKFHLKAGHDVSVINKVRDKIG